MKFERFLVGFLAPKPVFHARKLALAREGLFLLVGEAILWLQPILRGGIWYDRD